MSDIKNLKKQIIYRSTHRGTKEMDLLLGNFVKNCINLFNRADLEDLKNLLIVEDEVIYKWYFENKKTSLIINNRVTKMLKKFKLYN